MADTVLKFLNVVVFVILCFMGVVFLVAAPVDPTQMVSRLIIGIVLIVAAIVILAVISLVIQRRKYTIVKVQYEDEEKKILPNHIICPNCGASIELTDLLKEQKVIYCEKCGYPIKLSFDGVKW